MHKEINNKLKIYIDGQKVEQVSQFRYLGSLISEDGYCTKEIRSRIEWRRKYLWRKRNRITVKESGTKEQNSEALDLECITVCSRDMDVDADRQKKIRSV